jgi:C_GCAxxG_C_C family probable redox protein
MTEVAAGFGGGIGGEQDVCGAIAGGVMAIGYKEGRGHKGQRELADVVRPLVRALYEGFQARFGVVDCLTLTGYDRRDPIQAERSRTDPERQARCKSYKEYVLGELMTGE